MDKFKFIQVATAKEWLKSQNVEGSNAVVFNP